MAKITAKILREIAALTGWPFVGEMPGEDTTAVPWHEFHNQSFEGPGGDWHFAQCQELCPACEAYQALSHGGEQEVSAEAMGIAIAELETHIYCEGVFAMTCGVHNEAACRILAEGPGSVKRAIEGLTEIFNSLG